MQHLNFDHMVVPRGYTYYDKTIRIDRNPIRTALNVCKQLISKKVCNYRQNFEIYCRYTGVVCAYYVIGPRYAIQCDAMPCHGNEPVFHILFYYINMTLLSSAQNLIWKIENMVHTFSFSLFVVPEGLDTGIQA